MAKDYFNHTEIFVLNLFKMAANQNALGLNSGRSSDF